MLRRSLFKALGLGAAAAAVSVTAPQLVLPRSPGANRTYFLPPAGGWQVADVYSYQARIEESGFNLHQSLSERLALSARENPWMVRRLYDETYYLSLHPRAWDQFADLKEPLLSPAHNYGSTFNFVTVGPIQPYGEL